MKTKNKNDFFDVYTEFQCLVIAQLNKMNFQGLSAMHYNIVEYVYRNKKVKGVGLAQKLSVSQAAISKQVKFLIEKKLLTQKQDLNDRRIFYLNVTVKGKEMVNNSENIRKTMSDKISRILNSDELECFSSSLHKIVLGYTES